MLNRISWHEYFMAQAKLISLRGTCSRLFVGSVITRDKRVIAGGYNGSISGDVHCTEVGCKVVDGHCVRTIHAEQNALMQCAKFGVPTEGAEIYVTHFPCLHCTKLIIQAGIKHIYYETPYRVNEYSQELLAQAGVELSKIEVSFDRFLTTNNTERERLITDVMQQLLSDPEDVNRWRELQLRAKEFFGL
jgi:dCMP deaminase